MGIGVSTITSKWQVTIPGEIRKVMDVQVGERLAWEVRDGLLVARRLPRLTSLAGSLGTAKSRAASENAQSGQSGAAIARHKRLSEGAR